jgi:hypothetical protein
LFLRKREGARKRKGGRGGCGKGERYRGKERRNTQIERGRKKHEIIAEGKTQGDREKEGRKKNSEGGRKRRKRKGEGLRKG